MRLRTIALPALLLMGCICTWQSNAQPFASEIKAFKKNDSLKMPPKNRILFVGSSSFTKWTDVQQYFTRQTIINRGFGGSSLPDLIYYTPDVIYPYKPKQIVVYCGENDMTGKNVTADTVLNRFKKLHGLIRAKYPKVALLYVSIKPSPSRRRLMGEIVIANARIREFLSHDKHAVFVNVYDAMLQPNGQPDGSLFTSDSLHMNASGYALWKKLMDPYVLRSK
ncbi:MAG TPA: GDSL-type esterase/lipase family protein [Phnomibacter sp.]|nr:GDSL-type esterase/lipase family protein [Phnomibacter sp.]